LSQRVTVKIVSMVYREDLPGADFEYVVRNDSDSPIWLVNDGWLVWRRIGQEIELSYSRAKMMTGSHVFGYFPPAVVKVEPGGDVSRTIHLSWPLALDRLWNAESEASLPPGVYRVSARVGYGARPAPEPPQAGEDVEAPVFRWQREAVSEPVTLTVRGGGIE
jgi:hypothetical protein